MVHHLHLKEFLTANGVKQITSSPYHSSSNGLADWVVQTCKSELKKMDGPSLDVKLQRFLLNYRTTPQGTTGIPPSQLLMGRQLRTRLDQVIPDQTKHVQDVQVSQKHYQDKHARWHNIALGDRLLVHNYAGFPLWLPGVIKTVLGPVLYQIKLKDGRSWKRHQDQLLLDQSHQTDDSQVEEDITDFALLKPTATVDIAPTRCSTRIQLPPNKLTV